jgi:hypothetical protein
MEGISKAKAEASLVNLLTAFAQTGADIKGVSLVMVTDPYDGVVRPFLTASISTEADSEEAAQSVAAELKKYFPANAVITNENITAVEITLSWILSELISTQDTMH